MTDHSPNCPECETIDMHRDDCPRIGTCGQTLPWIDPPWHPDPDDWSLEWLRDHLREMHDA